jgi:hypothetical protein
MKIDYRLIQFQRDPLFPAPVSIGVIAWSGNTVRLKLLGLGNDGKTIRPGALIRAFRLEAGVAAIAHEWLFRFVELQRRRDDGDVEKLISELNEFDGASQFICAEAGEVDTGVDDIHAVIEDLYLRAVLSNDDIRRSTIEDRVESMIDLSEAFPSKESLTQDAEIELLPKGKLGRGLLSFLWFYDAEPRSVGIKVLDFGQDAVSVGRQVAEAINCFEVAISRKLLEPRGCILFHEANASDYPQYLRWIQGTATTIDVGSKDAADILRHSINL